MITIFKGKEVIKCSYKTYENQFKQLGYLPVLEAKKEVTKTAIPVKEEKAVKEVIEEKVEDKVEAKVEEAKKEDEKIGSKYGVKRRSSTKKED